MSDFYCWYAYYFGPPVFKNCTSDELHYAQGHRHGIQPTPAQWASLLPSLFANVERAALSKNASYPGDQQVLAGAQQMTRSAH